MRTISNMQELLEAWGADTVEGLSKRVYKETSCGAWAQADESGVVFGTIVEGSDAEFQADKLTFPFSEKDMDATIQWLEDMATEAWREANEE